jgi:hypothetical protein
MDLEYVRFLEGGVFVTASPIAQEAEIVKRFIVRSGALLGIILLMLPAMAGAGKPQLYQERLEVGRALLEVQSSNLPEVIPYYANDIEYHDPIVDIYGIEQMTAFLFQLFGSTPDLVTTVEDETLVGDIYSATWTMVGQFAGVPYEAKGITIIKFHAKTSLVYYQRDYYSEGDIMTGIPGLDQAILGFRTFYKCAVDPLFDCPLEGPPPGLEPLRSERADLGADNRLRSPVQLHRKRMEIGRALVEINAANWQSLLPYYAADYQYFDPIVDIYGFGTLVEFFGRLFANSPDLITTVEDETLQDGVYIATWTMVGEFGGIPYAAPGMSIVKFAEGSLQTNYSRDYYTEGDIMASIPPLDEAVAGFRVFYRCAVDPTFECPLEGPPTGAEGDKAKTPQPLDSFELRQNAPNPFNPATQISFVVPEGGANVSLRVYDVSGQLVKTLVDGFESSGVKSVSWQGRNDQGRPVASGIYFYRLTGPEYSEMKKMMLLK